MTSTVALQEPNPAHWAPMHRIAGYFTKHASHIALALILLLAAYLRLEGLGDDSLWVDECIAANRAQASSFTGVLRSVVSDVHPPLLHLMAYFTMKISGKSEFLLRLPIALSGIAACFFTFVLAGLVLRRGFGLIAAFLLAVSPLAIEQSRQLRPYSLLCMFGAIVTILFVKLVKRPTKPMIAVTAVFCTLMLYTHYVGIIYFAALLATTCSLFWRTAKVRKAVIWVALGTLLLQSPWLPVLAKQTDERPGHLLPFGFEALKGMFTSHGPFSGVRSAEVEGVGVGLFVITLTVGMVGTVLRKRNAEGKARLAIVCFFLAFLALSFLLSLHRPFFRPKSGLIVYPTFMVISALGIQYLSELPAKTRSRHIVAAGTAVPLVLIGLVSASQLTRTRFTDARGMALYVRENITSEPIVLDSSFHDAPGYDFYLSLACPDYPCERVVYVRGPEDLRAKLRRISRFERFWLISVGEVRTPTRTLAEKHLKKVSAVHYYGIQATLFTRPQSTDPTASFSQEKYP